ncbi:hypothetical protein GCM10009530_63160 [Microbispora corallina]|uniref:DNA-binding phage zinc finger domain-containing protein n=1 Tax=Microbispora corallina TaxID=83302 RepID=A0ABQ4GBR2_9ACTN|nr:hypothetical protein [Microbispora corallina]GIH44454.1 hypothetical protein Mco01_74540 [Microbispora corallina]
MADVIGADVRQLLSAIRSILTPPLATVEHREARDQLVKDRVAGLRGALTAIIQDTRGATSIAAYADIVRSVVTEEFPVTYPTKHNDEPTCRICGCTEDAGCPGGCSWVPDPEMKGEICSAHFVTAETLTEGQIVRCVDWADGELVRVLRVQSPVGEHYEEASVRYQDLGAHAPAVDVLVDRHHLVLPAEAPARAEADPARSLPQITVTCPTCGAQPGDLCTSHGGTRPRRHDTHQARRAAWENRSKDGGQ